MSYSRSVWITWGSTLAPGVLYGTLHAPRHWEAWPIHQCKPMSQGHNEWLVFNCMTHVFPIKVNQRSFSLQMNTLRSFLGSVFIVIRLQKVLRGDLREGKCHFFFFLKAFLLSKVFLIATIEPSMGHQLLTYDFSFSGFEIESSVVGERLLDDNFFT